MLLLTKKYNQKILFITVVSEVANDSRRKVLGVFADVMYPVGTCIIVTLAYFITNWRYLQMSLAVFTIPTMILIW